MSDRRGVAIVLVLLLILGSGALAHGALLTARAELSAARARAERVERMASERRWLDRSVSATDLGGARDTDSWAVWTSPGSTIGRSLWLRRIGPESWWASLGPVDARYAASPGRLLWWMDPETRVEALAGVVSVGWDAPVEVAGTIEVMSWAAAEPPLTRAVCEAEVPAAASGSPISALALLDSGVVRPPLGLLSFDTVLARTPVLVDGSATPAPVEVAGDCLVDDPWNWGDPERPSRPCGPHLAVRSASSSLRVDGGVGQGAWVVDGDLVLADGARLYGFVLTSGALVLQDGAVFQGAAVAARGVSAAAGTQVRGSACWAARALRAAADVWAPHPEVVPGLPTLMP